MRKQQQKAWAAEVKAVREEMEKQTPLLEQSREAALLEKQAVDQELTEKYAKPADGEGDCASERQRRNGGRHAIVSAVHAVGEVPAVFGGTAVGIVALHQSRSKQHGKVQAGRGICKGARRKE